jgi:thiamine-phosphate pyrophosphorylase
VDAPDDSSVLLTLVTDRRLAPAGDLPMLAAAAARAGVDLVQVREKDLSTRALRALVGDVVAAVTGTRTRVLVNGRPDVAMAAGADGVQLPEDGLLVRDVRTAFPTLVVGASRHSLEGARRAEDEGAHFVVLGPVFATPGKEARVLGPEALGEAVRALRIPVHAIGGIGPATAGSAVAAGARGLAAIRAFVDVPAKDAVRALRAAAAGRAG